MKKMILLVLMTMLVPAAAMAMDHSKMEMDHDAKKMDHGGMQGVVMLQDDVVDGVKGSAHLMDAKDGKGQMLMVMFTNEKTGAMISEGRCAVKIETPEEKEGKPLMMMAHNGMFGVNVSFDQQGMHHFKVGTKLADGQKRTFHFHHTN